MGLYVAHVLCARDSVFREIQEGGDIIGTLQQRWFMPRLCALHVGLLYELSNPGMFHAGAAQFWGPER